MGTGFCVNIPEVGGEDSKLYKELLEKTNNDRPLTNFIYLLYLHGSNIKNVMNNRGYHLNSQGQHNAMDVINVLGITEMEDLNKTEGPLKLIAQKEGILDAEMRPIPFDSAKDALEKARSINATYAKDTINTSKKGVIAYVERRGDDFYVVLEPQSSENLMVPAEVTRNLSIWNTLRNALSRPGMTDLEDSRFREIPFTNANNALDLKNWLYGIVVPPVYPLQNRYTEDKVKALFTLFSNDVAVQRIINNLGGTLDTAASAVIQHLFGGTTTYQISSTMSTLIDDTFTRLEDQIRNAITQPVMDAVKASIDEFEASEGYALNEELEQLQADFGSLESTASEISGRLNSLEEVAQNALNTLTVELRALEARTGVDQEVKDLRRTREELINEIASKRFHTGVLRVLDYAVQEVTKVQAALNSFVPTGDVMKDTKTLSKIFTRISDLDAGFFKIVDKLANIDDINIRGVSLDMVTKGLIKSQAEQVLAFFAHNKNKVAALREQTFLEVLKHHLGERLSDGTAVATLLDMGMKDGTWADSMFYSMQRVSNPVLTVMGRIIHDARRTRDKKIREYAVKMRMADNKLRKAGHTNTRFMYELVKKDVHSNGDPIYRIVSPYDWELYYNERLDAMRYFSSIGLAGTAFKDALETWEENHTKEIVVDTVSGRTERVPIYLKAEDPFAGWTSAQLEYYNTMMQIKGELATVLPTYAQDHYLPPQVRHGFFDHVAQAARNHSFKEFIDAIKEYWWKEKFQFRPDDTEFSGYIENSEFQRSKGDLLGRRARRIPIWYLNRVDPKYCLRDFTGAIGLFMGTALNYEAMESVKDTIEYMADYTKNLDIPETSGGKSLKDIIVNHIVTIIKPLRKYAEATKTSAMLDGFIDQHLYNIKLKEVNSSTKLLQTLLGYTSTRALSFNVKGMIANTMVGELQMLIEAGGGEFYGFSDLAFAHGKLFTEGSGVLVDLFSNNRNSLTNLLIDYFDPMQESAESLTRQRYYNSKLARAINRDYLFAGYSIGEHMIHCINMFAVLHNVKVKRNHEMKSLYDIFYRSNEVDGNRTLLVQDAEYYDEDTKSWNTVDEAFLQKIKDRIKYVNQTTHGSMNNEDKGIIHQYMLGRFIMNLRQWMVEHISRRARGKYWDSTINDWREGYYRTTLKLLANQDPIFKIIRFFKKDFEKFQFKAGTEWKDMSKGERANVRRALSEHILIAILWSLSWIMGDPKDHDDEFTYRMVLYQVKRAIVELQGFTPWGAPGEISTLINSPIAATHTVNCLLYMFTFSDMFREVKKGKHKGQNKWVRNMLKYWLPYYGQIEQLLEMDTDDTIFQVFENNQLR